MAAYNAPVHYTVPSTTPIRIAGSSDPPYRIINLETSGAVWLSDNAGLQAGQGTPCNPGTSLLWVRPGELWAIADDGVNAQIIITTEVEDWQPDPAAIAAAILNSGVLIVDAPVQLYADTLDAGNGYDTLLIDVTRYQSLTIAAVCAGLGGGFQDGLRIGFQAANVIVPGSVGYSHDIEFTFVGQIWIATIPIVNAYLRLFSATSTQVALAVYGSHRSQESIAQRIFKADPNANPTNDLFIEFIPTIIAGTTFTTPTVGPWFGEIEINVRGIQAAANLFYLGIDRINPATGLFMQIAQFAIPFQATVKALTHRLACAGGSYRFTLAATISNVSNATLAITPVSGFSEVA